MDSQNTLDIEGEITKYSCSELFAEIRQAAFSGSLRLSKDKQKIIAYFETGEIVFAVSNSRNHRLFKILLEENAVPKEKLVAIDGFTHDLHLGKKLIEEDLLTKTIVDSIFSMQIKQIINTVLGWEEGTWAFTPKARIKDGIKFEINLGALLSKFSNTLENEDVLARFKSFSESFSMSSHSFEMSGFSPTPTDAFILSRIGEQTLDIDEIRTISGLPNEELFGSLYRLWLGGVLKRENWISFFDKEAVRNIGEAKFTLKKSATSFEEKRELEKAAEQKEQDEKNEQKKKDEKNQSKDKEFSIDQYISRLEKAATHYEIFDVEPNEKLTNIKKIYFSYAKQFHPDLFHNKVDEETHTNIQNAFTEIARAYDTLKDKDSRELYDFKLRKVIEASKRANNSDTPNTGDFKANSNMNEADSQFEKGCKFLKADDHKNAIPYFERASRLEKSNAKFHAYLGKALSKGDKKQHIAEGELRTAMRLDRQNPAYPIMLSEFYIDMGLPARAKGELNRLLKTDPDNKDAVSLLDRLS